MGFVIIRNHDGICDRLRDDISQVVHNSEDDPKIVMDG